MPQTARTTNVTTVAPLGAESVALRVVDAAMGLGVPRSPGDERAASASLASSTVLDITTGLPVIVAPSTESSAPRVVRLLSVRAAGRLLGVSPGRTLAPLIRRGAIRTVTLGNRRKISMSEIERIEREGVGHPADVVRLPPTRPRIVPSPSPTAAELAAGIEEYLASF